MKKILLPILALGGLLFATSCQMDEPDAGTLTGEVDFTITAGIPGSINTYASNDGGATNVEQETYDQRFILEVYDGENYTNLAYREVKTVEVGEKTSFDVRLLAKKYTFALWADFVTNKSTADYLYNTSEGLDAVTINSNRPAGQEIADAYCYSEEVDLTEGSLSKSFTLRRPFGKIRLVSTDKPANDVNNGNEYTPESVTVTYGTDVMVPTGYNVLTGEASGENAAAGGYTFTPYQEEVSAGGTDRGKLYILGIDYIIASKSATSVSFDVKVDDNGTRSVTNIPVSANKLTTVIGNFYTNEGSIDVVVEDAFRNGEDVRAVWNGGSEEPAIDESNITINSAEQLAGLAKIVNERETLSGYTVTLNADIDLNNLNWTPIGTSTNAFEGNFNGNGHTISNLSVTVDGNNAGLFGYTKGGKVENIVINNASITGKESVGVLTGTPSTTEYSDITVKGLVKVTGTKYVGGILGGNNYTENKVNANLTNLTIDVEDGSYVKSENSNGPDYVGGVIGAMGKGSENTTFTVSNVSSNIDVIGNTANVGGIVGLIDIGNEFDNCSSSGSVTLGSSKKYYENYAYMIGGIAGTWDDEESGNIYLNNCEFTGELTSYDNNGNDISETIQESNRIVGRQFSAALGGPSKATLYIDGKEVKVSYWDGELDGSGIQLNPNDKTATINSAGGLASLADLINKGQSLSEYTVTLNTDIDLNNQPWTPIGLTSTGSRFSGTFDGNGKTISNLKIDMDPSSEAVGLFGVLNGTVKNLTITNANISHQSKLSEGNSSTIHGAAVVAGTIYNTGHVESVTVDNATIESNRYTGGIVGYFQNGKVDGCKVNNLKIVLSPDNLEGSYDNGDKAGGIVGYSVPSQNTIENNVAENITITGYRDLGGIAGAANASALTSNTASNITITVDQVNGWYGDETANAGIILGRKLDNSTLDGSNTESGENSISKSYLISQGSSRTKDGKITFTPESNSTYYVAAGEYAGLEVYTNSKTNVSMIALNDGNNNVIINGKATFGTHSNYTRSIPENISIEGFTVKGELFLCACGTLVAKNNKAAQLTVKTFGLTDDPSYTSDITLTGNTIDGTLATTTPQGYAVFIVPNVTGYKLTVTDNTFKNVQSHCFTIQGCGDGSAKTTIGEYSITGNTFESWGLGGSKNRGAVKVWADTKIAPSDLSQSSVNNLSEEARAFVNHILDGNNTFNIESSQNNRCIFEFYGLAFDSLE